MRELLVLSPLHIIDGAPISWVVVHWLFALGLFPSLNVGRDIGVRGFSPPVEVIEELVVNELIAHRIVPGFKILILQSWRNVAHLIQILRSDLGNVEVDEVAVVGVNLDELLVGEGGDVDLVLRVDAFVGHDDGGVPVVVAWGLEVEDPFVVLSLVLVELEEEVGLGVGDLIRDGCGFFLGQLLLEA
jgi:hypothetical protein